MQLLLHEEIPSSIQIHPIISMKARTEQCLSKKKKKLPKSFKSHESQMKPLIAKLNQVSSYTFQARYALSNPHFISLLMYIFYIYKYIHLSIIQFFIHCGTYFFRTSEVHKSSHENSNSCVDFFHDIIQMLYICNFIRIMDVYTSFQYINSL